MTIGFSRLIHQSPLSATLGWAIRGIFINHRRVSSSHESRPQIGARSYAKIDKCGPADVLTMRATRSERCRPYLATTGRRTSVTGLVGLAFRPTERFIGTRSSLRKEQNTVKGFQGVAAAARVDQRAAPEQSAFLQPQVPGAQRHTVLIQNKRLKETAQHR